ncbi:extracellular solute-binding protein [Zavarzinella formosa]|uniref:extracellular solute-binding protein n=1 Tax=Zavarzinella formosa TaxID=360055 RepID=UPI000305C049|nr:extracellular solute-binding protein [Zavarzinella formosa]
MFQFPIDRRGFLAAGFLAVAGCSRNQNRVTLYCAQDREFAEGILADFHASTGLEVSPKFDTEAQKSVSLFEEIIREKERPRCDVFWNNEILNTIRLQRAGLLEPITTEPGEFPEWTRPAHGLWRAFAARPRVLIVNTKLAAKADWPKSLLELTDPRWNGRLAMAKPAFGTTATQAACLFDVLGDETAKAFYRGLKANGIAVLAGNKPVAQAVADGRFAVGLTDADDAIGEIDSGRPVALVLPDRDGHAKHPKMGTLLIPNTLAVIHGCPNPAGAQTLVRELLSPATERRLAEGGGFQIPLNPKAAAKLHPSLAPPSDFKLMDTNWEHATDLWEDVQTFLRDEFAR